MPNHPADINRVHRSGKKSPRSILVKFASYRAKDTVVRARKSLDGSDIYLNDDLTRQRFQLLFQLRQLKKQKRINGVWTHDGTIVVKDAVNKIHYARLLYEAENLIQRLSKTTTNSAPQPPTETEVKSLS